MRSMQRVPMSIAFLVLVLPLVCLLGCGKKTSPGPPEALTEGNIEAKTGRSATPLAITYEDDGDLLYSIYRYGMLSRHISRDGRLMAIVGLESIPLADTISEHQWLQDNDLVIKRSSGREIRIPMKHARFSMEKTRGDSSPEEPHLWVPMIAPKKYPGKSNQVYNVVSGGGDNPLYYGGMALAVLSLEYINGMSDNSILFARKLVQFMLDSEMTGNNGYIVRITRAFNSKNNARGEPYLRGASAEELIGLMIGLRYYIEAEPDPERALHALELAIRVMKSVARTYGMTTPLWDNYEHPFMLTANDDEGGDKSFEVDAFLFPFLWAMGTDVTDVPLSLEQYQEAIQAYQLAVTLQEGGFQGGWLTYDPDGPFFNHALVFNTIPLILDAKWEKKEVWARFFMASVIRNALTVENDRDELMNNAFLGVIALWCNKYISGDPHTESQALKDLWGDDIGLYRNLVRHVEAIAKPRTVEPSPSWRWQHDLPLITKDDIDGDDYWKNHNLDKNIGGWFVWLSKESNYHTRKMEKWFFVMPGWNGAKCNWVKPLPFLNDKEYVESSEKMYEANVKVSSTLLSSGGYLEKELKPVGHDDFQAEGAGLGLLYLRMLLTRIDPETYPPPLSQRGMTM